MEELTNSLSKMTVEKKIGISSVDTAIITYQDNTQEVIKAPRPIYDKSKNFIQPEAYYQNGNTISWYNDGYIEMMKKDGTRIFWWEPPTIQDVAVGNLGEGLTAIFHKDGTIEMKRSDGMIWTWGVPMEVPMEDVFEGYEPPEQCDRCRQLNCVCGMKDW